MNAKKQDAAAIESFLATLAESLSLDPLRTWWPDYLFHTTELRNAVSILESGQLLSRQDADMGWDNANAEIIGHTPEWVKRMARFYFRPRTPMAHNNEGFRTAPNRHPHAYCPLPVMLIFPARPILTAEGTRFADGNCSSHEMRDGDDAAFFCALPFGDIYHDGPWQSGDADRIRHHRQAEVLVPSPLNIRELRPQIRVRSVAERETLLSLLPSATAERYRNVIQVSNKAPLFFKHWTYIESVQAFDDTLTIRFNESTRDQNPFQVRISMSSLDGEPITVIEGNSVTTGALRMILPERALEHPFHLAIALEGELAYNGMLDPRSQQVVSGS